MALPRGFQYRQTRVAVQGRRLGRRLREYLALCRARGFGSRDRLVAITARRAFWLCFSYNLEAGHERYDVANSLTRQLLDCTARLLGAELHGDPDAFAEQLRAGAQVGRLEDPATRKRLYDSYLLRRLGELYAWLDSEQVYSEMSGFVHLSHSHMRMFGYDDLEGEDPGGMFYPVGPPGGRTTDEAWLRSVRKFEDCAKLFLEAFGKYLAAKRDRSG